MEKIKEIIINIPKVSVGSYVRLALLLISVVNLALRCFGADTLPMNNEAVEDFVSVAFTVASTLAAYWKNNSFTSAALAADETLKELSRKKSKN